jgi:hypothetical protein
MENELDVKLKEIIRSLGGNPDDVEGAEGGNNLAKYLNIITGIVKRFKGENCKPVDCSDSEVVDRVKVDILYSAYRYKKSCHYQITFDELLNDRRIPREIVKSAIAFFIDQDIFVREPLYRSSAVERIFGKGTDELITNELEGYTYELKGSYYLAIHTDLKGSTDFDYAEPILRRFIRFANEKAKEK